ncbi:hypothetical protein ADEAN_000880600 [Angomonas deanei]|uniref:Uncharacterized protein n=1 Tax=Angomonas deanei TaxID=59799 RepID=A0A7G2CQL5_9TRYP|nr:hypothetical protein ADEAN_000880600 [Angomonas deanei]
MVSIYLLFHRCVQYCMRGCQERQTLLQQVLHNDIAKLPPALRSTAAALQNNNDGISSQKKSEKAEQIISQYYLQNASSTTIKADVLLALPGDHVNNSRYTEIFEYVRFYSFAHCNLYNERMKKRIFQMAFNAPKLANFLFPERTVNKENNVHSETIKKEGEVLSPMELKKSIYYVVSDTSMQFVKEIRYGQTVHCSYSFLPAKDPLKLSMLFCIYSIKEDKKNATGNKKKYELHTTAFINGCFLSNEQTLAVLTNRYEKNNSNNKNNMGPKTANPKKMVKLPVNLVLANATGTETVEEVQAILNENRKKWIHDCTNNENNTNETTITNPLESAFQENIGQITNTELKKDKEARDWLFLLEQAKTTGRKELRSLFSRF